MSGQYWPESRDEHSACVHDGYMIVYGGFERGVRQNTMIAYNFETDQWEVFSPDKDSKLPQPRAGHSAIIHEGKMYVFGGKDEDNEKLKDLWCFDFQTRTWTEMPSDTEGDDYESIISRSGHSAQVYADHMLIFGGIHEVTKELDDMIAYNLK